MIRDLARLASGDHDILIVGGGIHGLAVAYDAAQRGLSVALIERGDFGGATSFNHLKTIHGGLRYLQHVDLPRMREAVRERRAFARMAPNFVAPLPFVMPTSGSLARSRPAMRLALLVDALVAHDRNAGLLDSHHLQPGRIMSREECSRQFEGALEGRRFTGAALWHDYQTTQGDRLTLAFALAAAQYGALLANYTEAMEPLRVSSRLVGVQARDALTGMRFDLRARLIVNAAGPWASGFLERCGVRREWPLLKAMNLVTTRPARSAALIAPARYGRALVLIPWQGRSIVGTSESSHTRIAADQHVTPAEVATFLTDVNGTFPGLRLEPAEISLVHRGIVPAVLKGGRPTLLGRSHVMDHATDGVNELVSVIGVKYTTARAVAERTVDLVFEKIGRGVVRCRSGEHVLPGAGVIADADMRPLAPSSGWADASVLQRLVSLYGTNARRILDVADRHPSLQARLAGAPIIGAEVAYAVREEMAQNLTDVVVRRTALGACGFPGLPLVRACAEVLKTELGWPDERVRHEIDEVKRFYDPIWRE